jgi:integrase
MPLTDTAIRRAKSTGKLQKLSDGGGLQLHLSPAGGKLWRWAYRLQGKQKTLSLGAYPSVSLAQAREGRDAARRLLAAGTDPMEHKRATKVARQEASGNNFEAVAREWWAHWKTTRSESHTGYVIRRLEADVFPKIGARPIAEITAPELVAMVKAAATRGALDIAKRVLQTTSQVFRYAIAHGKATRNPAVEIKPGDVLAPRRQTNYARIDARELPALLRKIEGYQGTPITRLAIKLMALTFVRTGELIRARWSEFDLDAARWDIPPERMKMKTPHIVPLSTQAVEVLQVLRELSGHSALVFPGERDHEKAMSNNTILGALDRMGYKHRMTGHGFRGIASTVLHEQGFEHAHIELQLAHQERNAVSAAYNHALYLAPRTAMMQAWGDFLESLTRANVVPLAKRAA